MTALDGAAPGLSGARLERVVTGDGRRLVLKHLPRHGDWLTRFTAGEGRLRRLWESGVLAQVAATVDHGILAVEPGDDGGDVVVMCDVGDVLLAPGTMVPPRQARRLLAGLATLHGAWDGCSIPGLCSTAARYRLFAPALHAADPGPACHPFRDFILGGWEAFSDLVPPDVVDAVLSVHDHPASLADPLMAAASSTLVHGDAKLENLGLDGDRLVAIDWGELTGVAPAEVDVTWFAIQDGWRFDVLPDALFAAYDEHADPPLDARALDLACIGALAQFGFKLAGRIRNGDETTRLRSCELLAWWVDRVSAALSTWAPVSATGDPAR